MDGTGRSNDPVISVYKLRRRELEIKHSLEMDKENGTAEMKVTVPFEEFGAYTGRAADIYAKEGEVPGFRKGKAPRPMVIAHFGKKVIDDFALRLMACEATLEALGNEKVNATGKVHLDLPPMESGKPIEFTVNFSVGDETSGEPELPWPHVGDDDMEEDEKPYGPAPEYLRKPRR